MSFIDQVEVRQVDIQGENNWHWVKGDTGGFGHANDGPMRDWIQGHSVKYFEHVKNFNTVVTAGGNCGMHVRFYSKLFKYVYAYEPDPLNFHCMVNNAPYDNVIKLNAAVGDKTGLLGVKRVSPNNVGMCIVTNDQSSTIKVPTIPIDMLDLDACDLIQLDVEGYEIPAIVGALKTISKYKPVITAERLTNPDHHKFMEGLGYRFYGMSFMDAIYIPV